MTYTKPNPAEAKAHWDRIDEVALQHGRAIIAIPLEDEEGNHRVDKNGNGLAEFSYTYGNRQTGDAELLTFYPAQNTARFALNKLSKALEEGRLPYPKNHKEMVCVENFFPQTGGDLMYHALNADQRAFTNERYTCGHWNNEANIPILHVVIPLPDGNFLPVTPQPLMPTEDFEAPVAEYDNSKIPALRPNYIYRLTCEPGTEDWGKANVHMILEFLGGWMTEILLLDALEAKSEGRRRRTLRCEDAVEWGLKQMVKQDPTLKEIAEGVLLMDKQTTVLTVIGNNPDLKVVDGSIHYCVGVGA